MPADCLLAILTPKALCELLQKSADAPTCRRLHHYITYHGRLSDAYLPNYLIRVYARLSCLPDAINVFNHLVNPTVFSWSAIISAYVQHGFHEQAFELYTKAHESKLQLDGHVYTAMLGACVSKTHLERGKMVHGHIRDSPYKLDVYVSNMLLDMYARCGCLNTAREVFDGLSEPNIVSWNTLLSGYAQHKAWGDILSIFRRFQRAEQQPNQITYVCVFKACASLRDLRLCMLCHFLVVDNCLELSEHINNVLIDVYTKCGCLHDAEGVFVRSPKQDVITWTSIISGYVDHACEQKAFATYEAMQATCSKPNAFTYLSILKACAKSRDFNLGMCVHAGIVEESLTQSTIVSNALIGLYAHCRSLDDAHRVFEQSEERDVVSWNSIIVACSEHGNVELALRLFKQLLQEGFKPDDLTLGSVLCACSRLRNLPEGRVLHLHIIATEMQLTMHASNNLLYMYMGCGSVKEARTVFNSMLTHDAVTWNVMIGGCANVGQGEEALRTFNQMQNMGVHANAVTLVALLKACTITSALERGRLLHRYILTNGFNINEYICSGLISFYTKCGEFEDARKVFLGLQAKTLVPWSAMIESFAQQRNYREAFACFEEMRHQGVKFDDVVYLSLLLACSHAGILHEHGFLWQIMVEHQPMLKHYNCLADLLGRAGHVIQAKMVLENMPFPVNMSSWISLLNHSRTYACSLGETPHGL